MKSLCPEWKNFYTDSINMAWTKKKSAPRRKMIRRKRWARKPRVNVNRALQPVAQRYICKQKYSETITTDANGLYTINLNSVFDPNRTGIGHQPYGFDTMASLYNRYRVISCGWRIHANAVPGVANFMVAAMPANEVLTILSTSEWRENPRAKYVMASAGGNVPVLKGKTYIPSLVGRTKFQYMADDRYQAQVTASPNELAILNIATAAIGAGFSGESTNSGTVHLVLEYTVEYFDVKHLAQS